MRLHLALGKPHAQSWRIGVAVVDDDPNYRLLLRRSLDQSKEFHCVACYADGEEAIDALPSTAAQAVLLDIRMPRMSGIFCARRLKQLLPALTIIMVTVVPELDLLQESLLAGAEGLLDKAASDTNYCEAIRYALAGGMPLAKTIIARLTSTPVTSNCSLSSLPALNERESAVMECIKRGLSNKLIAAELGWSIHIVAYEVRRIFSKLRVVNRAEAVSRSQSYLLTNTVQQERVSVL